MYISSNRSSQNNKWLHFTFNIDSCKPGPSIYYLSLSISNVGLWKHLKIWIRAFEQDSVLLGDIDNSTYAAN